MGKLKLWLVRHGETEVSSDGLYRPSHGLTPRGRRQAGEVASTLTGVGIEACYTSALPRAIETAQHFTRDADVELVQIERLNEIDTGDIFSAPNEVKQRIIGHDMDLDYSRFGGESTDAFIQRVEAGYHDMLNDVYSRRANSVAAFLHGGTIAVILDLLAGVPFNYRNRPRMPNCAFAPVEVGPDGATSEWTGWEASHLSEMT